MKLKFWLFFLRIELSKLPYKFLGLFFYPFIKRTEVRRKMKLPITSWWTRQLWFMLNDDEIPRHGVDWDRNAVKSKGINTDTKWGRFIASYWFNAIRNPAYNYTLHHSPIQGIEKIKERVIDELFTYNDKGEVVYVQPIHTAVWRFTTIHGDVLNRGKFINKQASVMGEGKIWYYPEGRKDLLYCRWTSCKSFKLFNKTVYTTFKIGAFKEKFDIGLKIKIR